MSKIKNEKTAKELFGYSSSFGSYDFSSVAEERKDLNSEELTEALSDEETKTAVRELRERKIANQQSGRGRPKSENSENETRMTFVVNKVQLEKIREIGYRERKFTKEILFESLERYISDYEKRNGEVVPSGKSKL